MRSAIALKQEWQRQSTFTRTLARQFEAWRIRRRHKQRVLQLRNLSDHTLRDIGIPRSGIVSVVNEQSEAGN